MFGIKIISEKKYVKIQELVERQIKSSNATRTKIENMKFDNECLLNKIRALEKEKMNLRQKHMECEQTIRKLKMYNISLRAFKRDTLEALANIDLGSFRLQVCESKCDTCDQEPTDCKKYSFGSHTFCVIPKKQPSKE